MKRQCTKRSLSTDQPLFQLLGHLVMQKSRKATDPKLQSSWSSQKYWPKRSECAGKGTTCAAKSLDLKIVRELTHLF